MPARDNPTLAGLEARLSLAREEMRQMERKHTGNYIADDPSARTLHVRIAEIEGQVKRERATSQETNLAEAEAAEEAARTRDNVRELRNRLASDRRSVQAFSARFDEYEDSASTVVEALLLGFLAAWPTPFLTRPEAGPGVVATPAAVAYCGTPVKNARPGRID